MKQSANSLRLPAAFLIAALLMGSLGALPISSLPDTAAVAEEWGDPNGDGVWEIDSVDDLFAFAQACANNESGLDYFNGQTVRLMCDVNVNPGWMAASKTAPEGGRMWTPISVFKGILDGQGYTISGLYISGAGNQGFIWRGNGCAIRNLRIENSYIWSTDDFNGGVVASVSSNKCVFENVHSGVILETETTASDQYCRTAGGICGVMYSAEAEFTDCSFTGSVISGQMVGGILGTSNEYSVTMENCVNYGTVGTLRGTGTGTEAGGLIGRISAEAELIACANLGVLSTGNNQWNGGIAYLDRLTVTKSLSDTDRPTTVADVRIVDCYVLEGETPAHGVGLHGSRTYFDVTVSYTGGASTALTSAGKTTTWDHAKALILPVASVLELAGKAGWENFVLPLEVDGEQAIHLQTADDLFELAAYARAYGYYAGLTAKLDNDIDLNPGWDAATKAAPARVWVPIAEFRGTLDGGGHSISGVYVNQDTAGSGLIVKSVGATIQNLRLLNSYILSTSKNYIGSFVCSVTTDTPSVFRNLYSEAIVEGKKPDGSAIDIVGGILGGCYNGTAEMQNVVFNGSVSGSASVGGIVGTVNSAESSLSLSDCANYGEIEATANHNGGIVGTSRGNLTLNRCYNASAIPSSDQFSASLVYLECNTAKANVSVSDTYYLAGSHANALIAWHNWYALSVRYDGVQTGSVDADENTTATTNHSSYIRSLTDTQELIGLPAFLGWTEVGGMVLPAEVAEMFCRIPAKTVFVQEPTAATGDCTQLRVISTIALSGEELAKYTETGFRIRVVREDGSVVTGTVAGSSVYTSILADSDGTLGTVTAQELNADYLCALTVKNIPTEGTYRIDVRAFVTEADGNVTLDRGYCLTVTDGRLVHS